MSEDKPLLNIYDEVKSHSIYEMLTKDLDAEQVAALDSVIKEFSIHMQHSVLGPAMEVVKHARACLLYTSPSPRD